MGNANYVLSQGSALVIPEVVRDQLGNPVTTYTGSEALVATVWPGGASAVSFHPTATWTTPASGKFGIAITAAESAALDAGRYALLLRVVPADADPVDGFSCTLEVTASFGSGAPPKVYGSFQDLLDRAPWLEKLQRPTDSAGFVRQRALARLWFEDLLQRHYRNASGLTTDFYFVPGVSFGGRFGSAVYYRDGRRSIDLKGWLDADGLDVTSQVIDAVSCYAIALLCDRQVTPGNDNGYHAASCKYFAKAEDAALNISAEIDTNADGKNDTIVRLGTFDTLEG